MPFNFEDLRLRQANGELSHECYESAIFRLEKEIEELRQGGARVRSAAVIIAEDIGLPGLLDDTGPPPEPVYKLVRACVRRKALWCAAAQALTRTLRVPAPAQMGLQFGEFILLYPGDNVIGRGLGEIRTATVSRKQLCITIDHVSKRAFIRSMRVRGTAPPQRARTRADMQHPRSLSLKQAEKAPSLPAIMRSSVNQTNWRVLTQKGQSLSLGDTICMQIRPARAWPGAAPPALRAPLPRAPRRSLTCTRPARRGAAAGKEPGRLNEYKLVPLDTVPDKEPTFFEKLRMQGKIPFMSAS